MALYLKSSCKDMFILTELPIVILESKRNVLIIEACGAFAIPMLPKIYEDNI